MAAPPPPAPAGALEAVLLAPAAGGATLPYGSATVLDRLVEQVSSLGARTVHVVTRDPRLAAAPVARIHAAGDLAGELRAVAAVARAGSGPLLVAHGDLVLHREALVGLVADPRLVTAIVVADPDGDPYAPPVRVALGRVVSAGSAYHSVRAPSARFAGALKVAGADRPALAEAAERLAQLVAPPSAEWQATLAAQVEAWPDDPARRDAAAGDACALLLVGLIRSRVHVGVSRLRGLTCRRVLTPADLERAHADVAAVDEERARLDAAVKDGDGFFTTFFVSPYSKYIARWAARRGLTPNQVTAVSLVLGLAAAAAFALGSRAGLVAGAVLVQLAFTTDCVDGQLARYARRFSALGAWLDSVFDRVKEYAVYAGLAIGGSGLWVLATAALALQVARHLVDASFTATRSRALRFAPPPLERSADGPAGDGAAAEVPAAWRAAQRVTGGIWLRRIAVFPIGERFAAISLAAAFGSARLALVVLLAAGGVASLYTLAGRVLRSLA